MRTDIDNRNIFNRVTIETLKKNKVRTIVTIIGIILSASMICAVTTFTSSIYNYILENAIYNFGDWHGSSLESSWNKYEEIRDSDEVEHVVYAQQLGYAIVDGCVNENKPYFYMLGAGEDFENVMPIHITSGRYPTSTDEILIPNHVKTNGGVAYKIGDVLTLEIGDRMIDGYTMGQNNPFYTWDENGNTVPIGEELVVRETRTYTVVGFYDRPTFEQYTAPGYTAITIADADINSINDNYLFSCWFKIKKPKEFYSYTEKYEIWGDANDMVLMYSGVFPVDGLRTMISGLATIVIGLIMFASVSLIYNAFAISVSERTKQFGILASIGATKKQLKNMVLFEALAVSMIGIPLGILAGTGGISITLNAIGHKFMSLGSFKIPMRICVSWIAIVIAIVVALITVLISAWIPSKRAMKVSAVEAIRQNQDITHKKEKGSTLLSKLIYRIFGFSGMIAEKYYRRSRKKYRATIISLFMSIVLFVSASAFTDYLMQSVTGGLYVDTYDLTYYMNPKDEETITKKELLDLLKDAKSVTNAAYAYTTVMTAEIDKSYLTQQVKDNLGLLTSGGESDDSDTQTADINTFITFVNDEAFLQLLKDNGLKAEEFINPENPKAVVIDEYVAYSFQDEKYIEVDALKTNDSKVNITYRKEYKGYYYAGQTEEDGILFYQFINYENEEDTFSIKQEDVYATATLTGGKTIKENPYFASHRGNITFIYPESLINVVMPDREIGRINYYFTSDKHAESYVDLERILQEIGLETDDVLFDDAEAAEQDRNIIAIIQVFSYGFIILISLIAVANVFNTISTNIILRRRDFAMLKSVGMTEKGFRQMMNFECILYGTKALLYGLPVSVCITFLIYRVVEPVYETAFHLPWKAIGIVVFSVFAVVFVTMMYAMSKIKKENVIDALKNENL